MRYPATFTGTLLLIVLPALAAAPAATAIPLIVNEYNAVAPDKYLDGDTWVEAGGSDTYFATYPGLDGSGLIQGNGGNWIELVVTEDHVDIRGWKVVWEETFFEGGTPLGKRGGEVVFSPTASIFSNLRRGTILTISEHASIDVDLALVGSDKNRTRNLSPEEIDVTIDWSTDISYDPQHGDWWIHLSTKYEVDQAEPLVTTAVFNPENYNGSAPNPGDFPITHDDWSVSIVDSQNQVVFGPIGEAVSGSGIGGVNSREVVKLEADPTSPPDYLAYEDGTSSSFGQPNIWNNGAQMQDFSLLRSGLTFNVPGDYNGDGEVDAADYTVWRNTLGSTTNLAANGDDTGDSQGVIDEADYLVWKNNFGAGSAASVALAATPVPEPASIAALLLLAPWAAVYVCRRCSSRCGKQPFAA